ncbi:MAG: hypothetical protein WBG54_09195 [Acidobacteriaceae bacterium]
MRGIKTLLGAAALLTGLAVAPVAPVAQGQIVINIGVPPVCPYGYYDYAPYACAPVGFYGPGYFYNGIFLGVSPWAGWGYAHGWGHHRFVAAGGGRYHGNGGYAANHGRFAGGAGAHGASHPSHGNYSHASAPHGAAHPSHAAPSHAGAAHGASHSTQSHGAASHPSHESSPHGGGNPH